MMLAVLLSLFLYLQTASSTANPISNLTYLTPSVKSKTLIQINQGIYQNNCNLKVDKVAMLFCGDNKLYFMINAPAKPLFSVAQVSEKFVFNADMDDYNMVLVRPNSIDVLRNLSHIETISFAKEIPLLAKIKSKSEYILIASILLEKTSSEEQLHNDKESPSKTPRKFVLTSFIRGKASSSHRTRFPANALDFQLNEKSFKDATFYTDPLFGHDYFVVGLEKSWLVIFRSMFENSEMKFIANQRLEEDFEIIEMTIEDLYLFTLLSSKTEKSLKLIIYRIDTSEGFKLEEKCSFDLEKYFSLNYNPQLRVKLFKDIFTVMVNFQGSQIVVYHFRRPQSGVLSIQCHNESTVVVYRNAVPNIKLGHSFDYIAQPTANGLLEYGILLTPIEIGVNSTYYIPYCLPNMYRDPQGGCISCSEGFSLGGFNSTCLPCQALSNSSYGFLEKSDIIEPNCPPRPCKEKETFGRKCLSCPQYMESMGAVLPANGYWGLDSSKRCGLRCEQGSLDNKAGKCLISDESLLLTDKCRQLQDCMNCSMSQTCSWQDGSCRRNKNYTTPGSSSGSILETVFKPALTCSVSSICGETEHTNLWGSLMFGEDSVYKNQVCRWHINPPEKQNSRIELIITVDKHLNDEVENLPLIYIQSFEYNVSSDKTQSYLSKIKLREGVFYISVLASEMNLFPIVEQNMIGNARSFKIDYKVRPINSLLESILVLFRWIYYMIFLCIVITCTLTTFQKIANYYRRRRLLMELRGMQGFEQIQLAEERHHTINIEKILKDKRVVCKVVHDGSNHNKFNQTDCSICLEDFKEGENLAEFTCNHLFHINCFENWVRLANIQLNIKCPVCNRVLA